MTARPLTFASDSDNVLYDWDAAMRGWLTDHRGVPAHELGPSVQYDVSGAFGFPDPDRWYDEIVAAIRAGVLFHTGAAYAEALAANRRIVAAGHRFVIVTARVFPGMQEAVEAATRLWHTAAGYEFHDLVITHDKHEVDYDVLLDDSPANVRTCRAHGRNAVLLDRPWNRGAEAAGLPRTTWDRMPDLADRLAAARVPVLA